MTYPHTPDQRSEAIIILEEAGISPDSVCAFGITAQGYWEFQRDAEGRIIADPIRKAGLKIWREWPNQSVGSAIYQALNPR